MENTRDGAKNYQDIVKSMRDDMVTLILDSIEKNPTEWDSGWTAIDATTPINGRTNRAYNGFNSLYLYCVAKERGYKDSRWVTFSQAKELGASVKKGEKSSPVLFYQLYDKNTKKEYNALTVRDMTDEEKKQYMQENVRRILKYSTVFNAEQCIHFPERAEDIPKMSEEERARQNVLIEGIIENSAAPVYYDGGNRAYYSPGSDNIHLPKIEAFHSMQDYYATALHEIAHSTGHESRLNRVGTFVDANSYAVEELRAELASVFMQRELGITIDGAHFENHAAYLNSWLNAVRNDKRLFFDAVRDAEKISDYIAEHYVQAEHRAELDARVAVAANEKTQEKMESRSNYDINFRLNYSNEMLLSNELKKLGYMADKETYRRNEERDASESSNGSGIWVDEIAYNGPDGKRLEGYYGKQFNGIMLESMNMTGFTALNLMQSEVNEVAEIIRDFGVSVTVEKLDATQKSEEHTIDPKVEQSQPQMHEWLTVVLPEGAMGDQYGNSRMIKMPEGEYAHYALFVPSKFVKSDADGKAQLSIATDFMYRLQNDGRQVELTGQELRDSLNGLQIGKKYVRVAPSRAYQAIYENLEKNIPEEMRFLPNWCVYKTFKQEGKEKSGKVIKSAVTGEGASSNRQGDFTDFNTALEYAKANGYQGLAYLLRKQDGITCVDLDECLTKETGALKERAKKLVIELNNTYIERSTSGNGLHIFVKDDVLQGKYQKTSTDKARGDLEVYDDNKIISMTGDMFSSTKELSRSGSAATAYLRRELGEAKHRELPKKSVIRLQMQSDVVLGDSELIERIRSSAAGAEFDDLYSGRGVTGDKSKDDAKLANKLLFFNQGDEAQALRIMRSSGANRVDKPDSYYTHTISKMNEYLKGNYAKPPKVSAAAAAKGKGGNGVGK